MTRMEMFVCIILAFLAQITVASPVRSILEQMADDPYFYTMNLLLVIVLLCLGGVFAGLTIGLMALDETRLQLIIKCGSQKARENALKVIPIRKDGYLLLVTLLLANTIINESLPIITDNILGSGWEAILVSTFLLLIFAELVPQAACTRHGLAIGAKFVWLIRIIMFLTYPIAYPTARFLEYLLGKHDKGVYRRSELKELVALMGESRIDLSPDEVLMISGVLELRDKSPRNIMKPLGDVYMIEYDTVIDMELRKEVLEAKTIQSKGFSRIPIYQDKRENILGMILVKKLLQINPDVEMRARDLEISNLPRFTADFSLFSIFHIFKQGKSHMGIVENIVNEKTIPIGILTLEDLIEELIQHEILDETDQMLEARDGKRATRQASIQGYLRSGRQSMSPFGSESLTAKSASGDMATLLLDKATPP